MAKISRYTMYLLLALIIVDYHVSLTKVKEAEKYDHKVLMSRPNNFL